MQAFLQATAETRAAPRPLPSSDWMKVISQLGVSLRTLAWKRSLKLGRGKARGCGLSSPRSRQAHPLELLAPAERRPGGEPTGPLPARAEAAGGDERGGALPPGLEAELGPGRAGSPGV